VQSVDDAGTALTASASPPKPVAIDIPHAESEECLMAIAIAAKEAANDQEAATRFAKDHLKAFVERIERLEEEKKAIADDIRDVYGEAKSSGFDVKALRTVVRLRKQDVDERKEQEAILETYLHALGMLI